MSKNVKTVAEVELFLNKQEGEREKDDRVEKDFEVQNEFSSICGTADFLNCCPSKHQLSDSTLCNRMVMALFAVIMLWSTSLGVALSIVRWVIPTPTTEAVYSSCSYAYEVSADERSAYLACADRQLGACDEAFDEAVDGTLATALANLDYNTALLDRARLEQAACAAASTTAQAALGAWQEGGTEHVMAYDGACDPSDLGACAKPCSPDAAGSNGTCTCADVATMLNDISAARSEAFGHATDYVSYTSQVVDSLSRYASDRAAYDAEYIANHTAGAREQLTRLLDQAALPHVHGMNISFGPLPIGADALIACVGLRDAENYTACADFDSARQRFEDAMGQLSSQVAAARETFAEFADEASDYASNVATAVSNMADFYNDFKTWVQAAGVDTSSLGPWFSLGLGDFLVPDPSWPSGVGITAGDLGSVPGANALWNAVGGPIVAAFQRNITLAADFTTGLAAGWAADVGGLTASFPGFSPDDYDPPQYSDYAPDENVTAARKRHDRESEEFVVAQATNLNAFAEVSAYDDDDGGGFGGFNFTLGEQAYNFVSGLYFPFEPLRASNLNTNVWLVEIGSVAELFVYFDFIYRGYQSLVIFARFWSRAGIRIPDVDMRADRDQVKFAFMSPPHMVIHLLTTPAVWAAILAIFAFVFVLYFCAVYIPVLAAYKAGCVTGATNGTFMTNNLYSVAYNYAASDGNEDLFNGLSDYNVAKADYCSTYATSTQQQMNEDALFLRSLRGAQRATRDDVFLLQGCIDGATMDENFQRACCGMNGYDACSAYGTDDGWFNTSLVCPLNDATGQPFALPSTYLSEGACAEPAAWTDWELRDGLFVCGDVPDCTVTCGGPSKDLLRTVTEQCGCSSEWLLHASWLRSSIGLVVYGIMNFTRVIFLGGLCKLMWRYLSPGLFTYKATCDHRGNVLAPRDTEKYDSFTGPAGSLKHELNRTLSRFMGMAWLQVAGAVALNGVWIFFLLSAAQDIAYDPTTQD